MESMGLMLVIKTSQKVILARTVVHTQMPAYQPWSRDTIQYNCYDLTGNKTEVGGELYTAVQLDTC